MDLAMQELGTVRGGNHFVDLSEDERGMLWVGVPFGSRGVGHQTISGFIAFSRGLKFGDRIVPGRLDDAPLLFDADSPLGKTTRLPCALPVLAHHAETTEVIERLHPLGVAMAPTDFKEPYRD
jgi:tRNA-splicing ligase RtcB